MKHPSWLQWTTPTTSRHDVLCQGPHPLASFPLLSSHQSAFGIIPKQHLRRSCLWLTTVAAPTGVRMNRTPNSFMALHHLSPTSFSSLPCTLCPTPCVPSSQFLEHIFLFLGPLAFAQAVPSIKNFLFSPENSYSSCKARLMHWLLWETSPDSLQPPGELLTLPPLFLEHLPPREAKFLIPISMKPAGKVDWESLVLSPSCKSLLGKLFTYFASKVGRNRKPPFACSPSCVFQLSLLPQSPELQDLGAALMWIKLSLDSCIGLCLSLPQSKLRGDERGQQAGSGPSCTACPTTCTT